MAGVTRSLFVGAHARSRSWRRCSADLFCLACQLWMAANLAAILLSCSSSFSHRLSGVTRREERTLATGGSSGATGTLVGDVPFSGTCQGEVPLLPCVDNDAAEQVVIPAPGWLNEARGAAADDRGEELATRTAAVIDAPAGACAGACEVTARVRPMASARRRAPDMTWANGQILCPN